MNTLSAEQIGLIKRFSHCNEIPDLFRSSETEWKAIVLMQNSLTEIDCTRYLDALKAMGKNTCTATIDDRAIAFLETKLKR